MIPGEKMRGDSGVVQAFAAAVKEQAKTRVTQLRESPDPDRFIQIFYLRQTSLMVEVWQDHLGEVQRKSYRDLAEVEQDFSKYLESRK